MPLNLIPFYGTLVGRQISQSGAKATHSHVLVFGAIEAHSLGEKGCIASNTTIAKETGLSTSRVASVISELAAAKWIAVILDEKNRRKQILPLSTLATAGNPPLPDLATPLATAGNIDNNINNSIRRTTPSQSEDSSPKPKTKTSPKPEDEIKKLFYLVIKQYQLPVLNHSHISGWCLKLKDTLNEDRSKKYLNLLLVRDLNAERSENDFVPTLNRPLDIVDKAAKIIRYYNDTRDTVVVHGDDPSRAQREREREEEAERIRKGGKL